MALVLGVTVIACGPGGPAQANGNDTPLKPPTPEGSPVNPTTPEATEIPLRTTPYYRALAPALARRGMQMDSFCDINDEVARRILEDYGAIYMAQDEITVPPVCMFTTGAAVREFQNDARFTTAVVSGVKIELQPAAMRDLQAAVDEARAAGTRITPKGGAEGARRSYDQTQRLWDSRFLPALVHWQKVGRLTKADADRLRALPIRDQVREVLVLEKRGIYFSKDLSKSILYSVAAPGTSQHIAMLALDVAEYSNATARRILANHGWFQTVKSDMPHFTYLGRKEKDLPGLGLRSVTIGSQVFWIPDTTGK